MANIKTITAGGQTYTLNDGGAVRFDKNQSLTNSQKFKARKNMDAAPAFETITLTWNAEYNGYTCSLEHQGIAACLDTGTPVLATVREADGEFFTAVAMYRGCSGNETGDPYEITFWSADHNYLTHATNDAMFYADGDIYHTVAGNELWLVF